MLVSTKIDVHQQALSNNLRQ